MQTTTQCSFPTDGVASSVAVSVHPLSCSLPSPSLPANDTHYELISIIRHVVSFHLVWFQTWPETSRQYQAIHERAVTLVYLCVDRGSTLPRSCWYSSLALCNCISFTFGFKHWESGADSGFVSLVRSTHVHDGRN